jgi:exodeoxyribonuclease VII small subunit
LPPDPEIAFESAFEELEQIVADLERGDSPLAASLAKYERGIHLLSRCQGQLDGAERTVALLAGVDNEGQAVTSPFDATATADRAHPEAAKAPSRRPAGRWHPLLIERFRRGPCGSAGR